MSLHQTTFLAGSNDGFCIDGIASVSVWTVGNGAVSDVLLGDGEETFCGGWGGGWADGYGSEGYDDESKPCAGWGDKFQGDQSEPAGGGRVDPGLLKPPGTMKPGSGGCCCCGEP